MRLEVEHTTRYTYDAPVRLVTQYLRLTPRDSARQKVLAWELEAPAAPVRTTDGYGNVLHVLTLDQPVSEIRIRVAGTVETCDAEEGEADRLSPLLFTRTTALTRPDERLAGFARKFQGTKDSLQELSSAILEHMPFRPGETHAAFTAADAFSLGSGVCQDHTHVFIACCRTLGVPARYVSGYIYAKGPHVASHAWAEAWVAGGWRSFDVANRRAAGEDHIKLAIGADYLDACPIRGMRVGGGAETLTAVAAVARDGQ